MPQTHPQIPSLEPSLTILRFIVESDVVYIPDHIHAESRHRRIWEFYCNDDVLKARRLAFRCFKKEVDRFAAINKQFPEGGSPLRGLKLYFDFHHEYVVHRHYLHDGKDATFNEQMERREKEFLLLMAAGEMDYRAYEVVGDDGKRFWVLRL